MIWEGLERVTMGRNSGGDSDDEVNQTRDTSGDKRASGQAGQADAPAEGAGEGTGETAAVHVNANNANDQNANADDNSAPKKKEEGREGKDDKSKKGGLGVWDAFSSQMW